MPAIMFLASLDAPSQIAPLATHANRDVRRATVVALRRLGSAELTKFLDDDDPLVVLEAARAIYDEPVPVSMNALADMIDRTGGEMELVRRILHANYRLGTPEAPVQARRLLRPASRNAPRCESRLWS